MGSALSGPFTCTLLTPATILMDGPAASKLGGDWGGLMEGVKHVNTTDAIYRIDMFETTQYRGRCLEACTV